MNLNLKHNSSPEARLAVLDRAFQAVCHVSGWLTKLTKTLALAPDEVHYMEDLDEVFCQPKIQALIKMAEKKHPVLRSDEQIRVENQKLKSILRSLAYLNEHGMSLTKALDRALEVIK